MLEPAKEYVTHPDKFQAKFVNGFRVSRDQILLVTWYRTIVYNTQLQALNSTELIHNHEFKNGLQVCVNDFTEDPNGYLCSFEINHKLIEKSVHFNIE